ncbi:MAG: septum formation initiator family protein [Lachnospiraceae bacterium]|nr:septum formation initiator family protein [Lachnospiraceae bacterium]
MSQTRGREGRSAGRRHRNTRSIVLITFIVICFVVVFGVREIGLKRTASAYLKQEKQLMVQIEQEKERTQEIADLEAYMSSDRYIEDTAREKLGMAYPNDLLLKAR